MVCAHRVGSSSLKDARKKELLRGTTCQATKLPKRLLFERQLHFTAEGAENAEGNLWSCEVFSATSATSAVQFFVLLLGRRAKLLAQILIGSRPQDKQSIQEAHGPSVDAPRRDGDESGGQREGPSTRASGSGCANSPARPPCVERRRSPLARSLRLARRGSAQPCPFPCNRGRAEWLRSVREA